MISLFMPAAHAGSPNAAWVERVDDAIHYRGPISADGHHRLLALHRDSDSNGGIKWLVITSSGGEVNLAMDLGDWIYQYKLNVRVIDSCLSSCANYIFTAATVKVITPGAIVAWHGSAIQSDAQSQTEITELIEQEILPRTPSSQRAAVASKLLRETLDDLRCARQRQARFFEKIRVDERITTIGEGHPAVKDFWFLSVAAMARFGVGFVVAPSDYATTDTTRFGDGAATYINLDAKFRSKEWLDVITPATSGDSLCSKTLYRSSDPFSATQLGRLAR